MVYGHVSKDDVSKAWNGTRHKAFMKLHLEGKRFSRPQCKNCVTPNDVADERDIIDGFEKEILIRMNLEDVSNA